VIGLRRFNLALFIPFNSVAPDQSLQFRRVGRWRDDSFGARLPRAQPRREVRAGLAGVRRDARPAGRGFSVPVTASGDRVVSPSGHRER
jgi:hypothetical protein